MHPSPDPARPAPSGPAAETAPPTTGGPHPSLLRRKIIHFDMDAFYASIEVRDDPSLAGKPVVVGGPPDSRAVVCTASYEARRFGIHSAMPCSQAARLCPEAVFLRPDFEKYGAASRQIREVFGKYARLVEPLSLDEAYLDVTDNPPGLYAVRIARLVQEEVYETTRLTGSAGVAPNKLLAKIASDMRKPRGLTAVLPERVLSFMGPLPLRRIHGIGPVTEKRLAAAGLHRCRDVWPLSLDELTKRVGRMAAWLSDGSRGLDERPVEPSRERKSLGREETFGADLLDVVQPEALLAAIARDVAADLRAGGFRGRTITLKVRYDDFTRITRSRSFSEATDDETTIRERAGDLLRDTEAGRRRIRLLGISLSNLAGTAASPTSFGGSPRGPVQGRGFALVPPAGHVSGEVGRDPVGAAAGGISTPSRSAWETTPISRRLRSSSAGVKHRTSRR